MATTSNVISATNVTIHVGDTSPSTTNMQPLEVAKNATRPKSNQNSHRSDNRTDMCSSIKKNIVPPFLCLFSFGTMSWKVVPGVCCFCYGPCIVFLVLLLVAQGEQGQINMVQGTCKVPLNAESVCEGLQKVRYYDPLPLHMRYSCHSHVKSTSAIRRLNHITAGKGDEHCHPAGSNTLAIPYYPTYKNIEFILDENPKTVFKKAGANPTDKFTCGCSELKLFPTFGVNYTERGDKWWIRFNSTYGVALKHKHENQDTLAISNEGADQIPDSARRRLRLENEKLIITKDDVGRRLTHFCPSRRLGFHSSSSIDSENDKLVLTNSFEYDVITTDDVGRKLLHMCPPVEHIHYDGKQAAVDQCKQILKNNKFDDGNTKPCLCYRDSSTCYTKDVFYNNPNTVYPKTLYFIGPWVRETFSKFGTIITSPTTEMKYYFGMPVNDYNVYGRVIMWRAWVISVFIFCGTMSCCIFIHNFNKH